MTVSLWPGPPNTLLRGKYLSACSVLLVVSDRVYTDVRGRLTKLWRTFEPARRSFLFTSVCRFFYKVPSVSNLTVRCISHDATMVRTGPTMPVRRIFGSTACGRAETEAIRRPTDSATYMNFIMASGIWSKECRSFLSEG